MTEGLWSTLGISAHSTGPQIPAWVIEENLLGEELNHLVRLGFRFLRELIKKNPDGKQQLSKYSWFLVSHLSENFGAVQVCALTLTVTTTFHRLLV